MTFVKDGQADSIQDPIIVAVGPLRWHFAVVEKDWAQL